MDVKVTVIVPVHNVKPYISEALDSLLNQDFKDYEVLCIDSSTDGTTEIIKEYEKRDSRFRLIEDGNSSYGYKMNRGIREAGGKYISILESDDLMKPEMLSTLYQMSENYDLDFVKCSFTSYIRDEKGEFFFDQNRFFNMTRIKEVNDLTASDKDRMFFLNNIWSGMYKKTFLFENEIVFHESSGASYQDTGFSFLCIVYGKRAMVIPECLYSYRRNREGSSVKDAEKYRCIYDEVEWIGEQLKKCGLLNHMNSIFLKRVREYVYLWNLLRLEEDGREKFLSLLEDRREYEHILEGRIKVEASYDEQFLKIREILLARENTALFGAGRIGKTILMFQKYIGRNSVCVIMDNDESKWGTMLCGVPIVSLDKAIENEAFGYVIVASGDSYDEIKKQLVMSGVNNNRIIDASGFPVETAFINRLTKYGWKDI